MDNASSVQQFDPPGVCALCHRTLPLENDVTDLESISICGDCKFLFFEDGDTPSHHTQRRTPRPRRTRYTNSSESIDNIFSHQFSTIINQSRHNPPTIADLDNRSIESSRTTPNTSRRYRRVISDTESEGFDSVYGESDAISFGVYGGDSDNSVDVHSFLGDSDTDIDPMHAGLNQWSSDDEWEELEDNENNINNTLGSLIARVHLQRSLESDNENAVRIRIRERRRQRENNNNNNNVITTPFGNFMEEGHFGDYLDARSFEELVERLAEADSGRRGAPPASVSFVENLEKVVVNEEIEKVGCAICKESFCEGSEVNRLPCFHVYHGLCIKPWLSARNSCPLCRYELPTDDLEYENRKESSGNGLRVEEMEEEEEEDERVESSFHDQETVNDESGSGRGRWFFVASLVGIGLALWLGNPGAIRVTGTGTGSQGQRGNRSRRWWSLF